MAHVACYLGITKATIPPEDTQRFARYWPCSTLGGAEVYAELDRSGTVLLVEVDGQRTQRVPGNEVDALLSFVMPESHGDLPETFRDMAEVTTCVPAQVGG